MRKQGTTPPKLAPAVPEPEAEAASANTVTGAMWSSSFAKALAAGIEGESKNRVERGAPPTSMEEIAQRCLKFGAVRALQWAVDTAREHGIGILERMLFTFNPTAGTPRAVFVVELEMDGPYDPDDLRFAMEDILDSAGTKGIKVRGATAVGYDVLGPA